MLPMTGRGLGPGGRDKVCFARTRLRMWMSTPVPMRIHSEDQFTGILNLGFALKDRDEYFTESQKKQAHGVSSFSQFYCVGARGHEC